MEQASVETKKPKKERKPPTERQAFSTWVLSLVIVGMGIGVAICGLNGTVSTATGDAPPGPTEFLVVGALTVFVGTLILRGVPKSLKVLDRFAKDKQAVSPVIAVILMVAITVVLAAVVFVLVSDIATVESGTPNVTFERNQSGDNGTLTVIRAPIGLLWTDLDVDGCQGRGVNPTVEPGGQVSAGDFLYGCRGMVRVVHTPSNSLVYQTEF